MLILNEIIWVCQGEFETCNLYFCFLIMLSLVEYNEVSISAVAYDCDPAHLEKLKVQ
jgi:hypothetical protein